MKIKGNILEEIKVIDLSRIRLVAEDEQGFKFLITLDKLISLIQLKNKETD